jgi:hypothetical protein
MKSVAAGLMIGTLAFAAIYDLTGFLFEMPWSGKPPSRRAAGYSYRSTFKTPEISTGFIVAHIAA